MLPASTQVLSRMGAFDPEWMNFRLEVEPLVNTSEPIYCNNERATVEHVIRRTVCNDALTRASAVLSNPDTRFNVGIELIDTDKVPDFSLKLGLLTDMLFYSNLSQSLQVEKGGLGILAFESPANIRSGRPAIVTIGLNHYPEDQLL